MEDLEQSALAIPDDRPRLAEAGSPARDDHGILTRHTDIQQFLAKDLFFIGAFPKSGSTWLQVMLNAHPEIGCHGEGHFFDHFWPLLEAALTKHNQLIGLKNATIFEEFPPFPQFNQEHLHFLMASAVALLLIRGKDTRDKRVVGEKTPNNLLHLERLEAVFPTAKFVQIVRDGRDCAVSAWFHNHRTNPTELRRRHGTFASFANHIAEIWSANVEIGLRFRASRAGRCHIVRYEDLCRDPHEGLRAVLSFLNADTSDAVVRRCVAEGSFERMSGGRSPGVEDRASFLRRGIAGDWRNHFTLRANRAFVAIAGGVMGQLGYHR
jgi:hypothetical protein